MSLWLNQNDVQSLLTMPDAIDAVEEAFRQLAEGDAMLPQRVGVGVAKHGGGGAAMPAYVGGEVDGLGVKVVTLFVNNARLGLPVVNATILLLDPATGQLRAVMDGGYLTAVRTGAVSGVATNYLARADASIVTIFGAGVQARKQLEAMCAVRPIAKALVVNVQPETAKRFADEMSASLGVGVRPAADTRNAVEAADIIITATSAHDPIFDGSWVQPGTHINAIGSHAPAWRELDTTTLQRAKVIADQATACLAEAGDLIIPIQKGAITEEHIYAELGEIVAGSKPGREGDDEITLFKSVGLAIQDVAVAALVYRRAQEAGVGQILG
ncbi:MAG: ornithine cyclodeaminase family protein [Chloroflexota bacterium]|nr:ornithine cyclodeaminase family protein [Chloroflexota bacterium]